jgi:hypothetical protein
MPYFEPSRPMPLSFIPPKGAISVEMMRKAHVRCLKQCFSRPPATVSGQCRVSYGDFLPGPAFLGLRMA